MWSYEVRDAVDLYGPRSSVRDVCSRLGFPRTACHELAIVVSELTSNTATATILVPVVIGIANEAKVSPLPPALAATFACSFGFMLPVSTPQNAIVYGSGVVPITKMIRSGIGFDILGALLIVLLLPVMVDLVLGSVAG